MVVIEGLKNGPVNGEVCNLTLYDDGDVIEHFEDNALLVGKWKVLKTHGRLIDADALKSKIIKQRQLDNPRREKFYNKVLDFIFDAPTVLEASE